MCPDTMRQNTVCVHHIYESLLLASPIIPVCVKIWHLWNDQISQQSTKMLQVQQFQLHLSCVKWVEISQNHFHSLGKKSTCWYVTLSPSYRKNYGPNKKHSLFLVFEITCQCILPKGSLCKMKHIPRENKWSSIFLTSRTGNGMQSISDFPDKWKFR